MNSNQQQTYCLRTQKLVKTIKGKCSICGRNKSQIFTKKMTREGKSVKESRCKKDTVVL